MKISGANLLSRIPPFFNTMIGKIVVLILLILLLVGVYSYFSISNEVKIIYFSTKIDNLNGSGYSSFINKNLLYTNDEDSRRYRGAYDSYYYSNDTDSIQSFTANLVLDYSGKQRIGHQEPIYEVRTVVALDSIDLQNKRDQLYSTILDTLAIDSIVNSVLIEIESGGFIPNNYYYKKDKNIVIYDTIIDNKYIDFPPNILAKLNLRPNSFSYVTYDTIIDNKYFNMPTIITGKMTHLCPNSPDYYVNDNRGRYYDKKFVYISHPNFPLTIPSYKKSSKSNLYKNPSVCCLIMDFLRIKARRGTIKIDFQAPMYFATVSPTPDEQTASTITYYNNEKLQQIYKNGIYVYAESLLTKKNFDNRNFILATIIGFLFSMIVDILYRLSSNKNSKIKKQS